MIQDNKADCGAAVGEAKELPRWFPFALLVTWAAGIVGAWQWTQGAFAVGSALIVISVLLLRSPRSMWAPTPRVDLARRWQRWGLLAVCAVGVFFRCYRMEPPGLWGDDAINGLLAFDVLDGNIGSPFKLVDHSFSTFHALSNYLIAGAFLLWGPDPLTIRVPGIVANLLAVPLLYTIVAPLFGPRAALIAALFFASSPFQLGHAKGLLQDILGQSFAIAGLGLMVQGALRGRRWMFVAAAIPIALALYTYHAAKLVPAIAAFAFWQLSRIARMRGIALGRVAMVCGAIFLLCAIPAVRGYVRHPDALTARLSGTGLWGTIEASGTLWPLWDSLWRTLAVFHYQQGPIYHWFGIGTDPGVNVILGCLVVHGLVQSLWHWRHPAHALLLGWFALGLIPGLLSSEAPRGYRILGAAPVVFVWAALPLARVLGLRSTRGVAGIARIVAIALVVAVPIVDFNYYFYRVYTSGVFRWFQATPLVAMARELRSYGPEWTGYIVADNFTREYETLRFLARAWDLQLRDVPNFGDALPVRDVRGGALFMIMRTPFEGVDALRSMYPDIKPDARYEPVPRWSWFDQWFAKEPAPTTPMTVGFFPVSREAVAKAQGLNAIFVADNGATVATRVDPQPRLEEIANLPSLPADAPPATRAVWSGSLFVPVEGTYGFRVQSKADALVAIGTSVAATHQAPASMRTLAQGLHPITVIARLGDPLRLQLLWQPPGEAETVIPPEMFFRVPVHGLLAEYQTAGGTRRRIEPFPFHMFFAAPFDGPYSGRWTGRITIPAPGGYRLSVESDRAISTEIDGRELAGDDRLTQGAHTIAIQIAHMEGAPRLRMFWQQGESPRNLIPPDAMAPE